MPLARAGEIELSYERAGSGPPLLMIMGMSGTALHWGEPFLDVLREDFETIVYDHRGVGRSSRMEEPFTIAQLAEDAAGLLDALELDSAHVLGISMGGMVAQELALAHPERIRTLTLGCTYCGGAGSSLTLRRWPRRLGEARMLRRSRARDPRLLGGQRLAELRRRRRRVGALSARSACERRGRRAGDHGADCWRCAAHDT